MYWNGTIWISQPHRPSVIEDVELEKEKHHELKEEEDKVDDIYKSNKEHQKEDNGEQKTE